MKLTYSKFLPVILATFLAAGSVMASETSDKGVDLNARQSQKINKKSAPIVLSPGSRGHEGHGAVVITPGAIPPGSRGNEGGAVVITPGSRGNEGGSQTLPNNPIACPMMAIMCKAGEKAVYEPNSCKQSCVTDTAAKVCPQIGLVCNAGEHAVMDANCKQSCVADTAPKVCPMVAIVCKEGETAVYEPNSCKQSCVKNVDAGSTTQAPKQVFSNPAR